MMSGKPQRALWMALVAALLILGACSRGARTGPDSKAADSNAPSTTVPWQDAALHVGELVVVEGPVVDTHFAQTSNGQPTFLNLGKPYPDPARFTVVIWGENRPRFPQPPETLYRGKTIRVSGTISRYQGRAEIVADGPEDIRIAE